MLTDDYWKLLERIMKVNFVSKLTEKNEILALISDEKSLKDIGGLNKNLL